MRQMGVVAARVEALENQIQQVIESLKGEVERPDLQGLFEVFGLVEPTQKTQSQTESFEEPKLPKPPKSFAQPKAPTQTQESLETQNLEETPQENSQENLQEPLLQPQLQDFELEAIIAENERLIERDLKQFLTNVKAMIDQFVANGKTKILQEVYQQFSQEVKDQKAPLDQLLHAKLAEIEETNQRVALEEQEFAKLVESKRKLEVEVALLQNQLSDLDKQERELKEELVAANKHLNSLKELQKSLKSGTLVA